MAYIGKTPVLGNFVKLDSITVVNGQSAYTMQNGGVNFTSYDNVNQFLVSLNGILQSPTDSFTVSGSTLTFASNLSTGDVIDFVMVLGNTLDVGTPSDNTVSLAKLTATGTKDATTFLRGDNSFQEVPAGGITEADLWRLSASLVNYQEPIASNWERADERGAGYIGTGMTESSGVFTFPSTGFWKIEFVSYFYKNGDDRAITSDMQTTTDGTNFYRASSSAVFIQQTLSNNTYNGGYCTFIMDVTNTSTHKVRFVGGAGSITIAGSTTDNLTHAVFTRLGDT